MFSQRVHSSRVEQLLQVGSSFIISSGFECMLAVWPCIPAPPPPGATATSGGAGCASGTAAGGGAGGTAAGGGGGATSTDHECPVTLLPQQLVSLGGSAHAKVMAVGKQPASESEWLLWLGCSNSTLSLFRVHLPLT
eukprot:TRINITY_DN2608_c0_g3_i5.p2 TRINITY_DN2608_c0_g3~~TRINITY_DN2608_c0_g3_i5.p2  ORF type:complete len:137 (-),score=48.28 TRINITY_DN2608_c0_g3_i5:70-480(-)